MRKSSRALVACFLTLCITASAFSQEIPNEIRALLKKYCTDCHGSDLSEAEVDFDHFQNLDHVRQLPQVWIRTREMLDSRQMPPKDASQPTDAERELLQNWVRDFLTKEARATAGDPGPVLLRRLNNEEYNYTIRDLTGVMSLTPTNEFPVDGAAGEGFINTGLAQAMSPAMVSKYLEAAQDVASHLVLLPDGITFSSGVSRGEWTAERLKAVQHFYSRYTVPTQVFVEVGGTGKVANDGGTIPFDKYLLATIEERSALNNGTTTIAEVASQRDLNSKYLGSLWSALNTPPPDSFLVNQLSERWDRATPAEVPQLLHFIEQAQQQLWTFHSIGQLTKGGQQKRWMSPVSPIITEQEFRIPLKSAEDTIVVLHASTLIEAQTSPDVLWQQPRLEFPDTANNSHHTPILLRDVRGIAERVPKRIQSEIPRTAEYLGTVLRSNKTNTDLEALARELMLNLPLLQQWAKLVDLDHFASREIQGLFTQRNERVQGYAELNGWGSPQTPSMLTNRGTDPLTVSTLTVPPRGVVMHPSPTKESFVAWRCPAEMRIKLTGLVADADNKCGNGAAWRIEIQSMKGRVIAVEGEFDNGGESKIEADRTFHLQQGDVVSVLVNARDNSHVCDTTHIEFTLTEVTKPSRHWDLATDVVDQILSSNPLPDTQGHRDIWHFGAVDSQASKGTPITAGSALSQWRTAIVANDSAEAIQRWAMEVQTCLTRDTPENLSDANRHLRTELLSWTGPLNWAALDSSMAVINESDDIRFEAPRSVSLTIPKELSANAEFVVSAKIHPDSPTQGAMQVRTQLQNDAPQPETFSPNFPILIADNAESRQRVEAAFKDFRNLFPPAVCYSRIVPVDEVVTLTLYFREDEHLQRLMLSDQEIAELDRLWDELLYVAQEPIALTVALEQIYEFATQDRPDLVNAFEPMRTPINARADQFRQRLQQTEPIHLNAVIELANRAWRRPLNSAEQSSLREFYQGLRDAEITHDEALRLTVSRILTSPAFLYRREQPGPAADAVPVTSAELATRLSYFLWSSQPDQPLRDVAASGQLTDDTILKQQTRRMLKDDRIRRLAIQFACQWLHLRDFDQNDDKNEHLYPQFSQLRGEMYEETVRFFEDMFRNNGCILDILNADHTFLNESLARHYGLNNVTGPEWRRVDGVRESGRGGILGMGAFLASQSGASRTSPILRGNWVYETLLGERLPRPPANVPQLPQEVPTGLTARQLIEMHSSAAACARCHQKIDPYGFALEQYDAIGRLRPHAVDTSTTLEDGTALAGFSGISTYLLTQRRDDVVQQFCRKLLGFSLGREVQLSDELLLRRMQQRLQESDYRFQTAVETIVLSPQFRRIRGQEYESPSDREHSR